MTQTTLTNGERSITIVDGQVQTWINAGYTIVEEVDIKLPIKLEQPTDKEKD
jgi:hypothetical protein